MLHIASPIERRPDTAIISKAITKIEATIVIWIRNIIAPLNERLTIVWHIAALDKDVWPTGPFC
jgi:hypothetical protein